MEMAGQNEHRKHLAKYLSDRKTSKTQGLRSKNTNIGSTNRSSVSQVPIRRGKVTVHDIPDEIILLIFSYLSPQDLIVAAQVNKAWHSIASDNSLWKPIFQKYANFDKKSATGISQYGVSSAMFKAECIKRCVAQRNKRTFKHMKRKSPYTGLSQTKDIEQASKAAGLSFQLAMVDSSDHEHSLSHQDVSFHLMSTSVRWFSLQALSLHQVKQLRIYSCNPLFFDVKSNQAIINGPYQRSLLLTIDLDWRSFVSKHKPKGGDEMVNLYQVEQGMLIVTWKSDGEFAFIHASLSHDNFIQRCLYGNPIEQYIPPSINANVDDVQSRRGLIDYSVTIQLRTMKKGLWDQQFRNLDCKDDKITSGFARFTLVRSDQRQVLNEDFLFPWKTDAFRGKVQNVIWLDMTMLDEDGNVFWIVSSIVSVKKVENKTSAFDFDYSCDQLLYIEHAEEQGKMRMEISQMDHGETFISGLTVMISKDVINSRFGTNY